MADQSELLHKRKVRLILCSPEHLANTLDAQEFTHIKSHIFRNQDTNDQNDFVNDTSGFTLCQNTQSRPNRKHNIVIPMFSHCRKGVTRNGFYWDQKKNDLLCTEKEFQDCDEYLHRRSNNKDT